MIIKNFLVHNRTLKQINSYLSNPSHALILVAPDGSGKRTLAKNIAMSVLGLSSLNALENYPFIKIIDPIAPTISIEEVREVQKFLTLKTPKTTRNIRRVVLIVDVFKMRTEAQNAFLKSLEEPPADTCIIFTAESTNDLLPTILSRMQRIDVYPISKDQAQEFYSEKSSEIDININYLLSQGQPGLFTSLMDNEDHDLKMWVKKAKSLLSIKVGERLMHVDELSKDKTETLQLIAAIKRIAHAALISAGTSNNISSVNRWQRSLNAANYAAECMAKNANTKLTLDYLLLNI